MRILHFAQSVAGGISSYFDEIAPYQIGLFGEDNVKFFVPMKDVSNLQCVPLQCIRTFTNAKRTPSSMLRLGFEFSQAIRDFKPDVVHLHSTFAGAIGRIALVYRSRRPLVVYCPHGWAFGRNDHRWIGLLYAFCERLLSSKSDACVQISAHEFELARSYNVAPEKCYLIQNGIADVAAFQPEGLLSNDKKVKLLFVGRHDPQKGLDILLNAMERVPDRNVHLTVIGESVVSSGALIDYVRRRNNVTFLGRQDRSTVWRLMSQCDAVVVPSRWEGFGLVAIEAMRAGKAVIASNRGALPDIVKDGSTGIIADIDSLDDFADTIKSLRREQLETMGLRAKEVFISEYTANRMNASLVALYLNLNVSVGLDFATVQRNLA